jgi:hypothetical protein
MPPLTTATAKVHSADENQVGANNGGGIYRWPEFDSQAGVSRLQPYPRLAHASYSLRKVTTPKNPVPLEPNWTRRGRLAKGEGPSQWGERAAPPVRPLAFRAAI